MCCCQSESPKKDSQEFLRPSLVFPSSDCHQECASPGQEGLRSVVCVSSYPSLDIADDFPMWVKISCVQVGIYCKFPDAGESCNQMASATALVYTSPAESCTQSCSQQIFRGVPLQLGSGKVGLAVGA